MLLLTTVQEEAAIPVKLNSTGGGSVTLTTPSTASDFTATFPANTGNVVTTGSSAVVTPAMLSTGAPSWDSSSNLAFNSGYGSAAVAYGCRAWVNFNGTGTVAIRASGNVTSITDSGTGQYTVNFTNSMPDANYSAVASLSHYAGVSRLTVINVDSPSTNSIGLISAYGDPWGHYDPTEVYLAIFR